MTARARPSLHTVSQRPYYIEAPGYRRNSVGIRVMHMLCHLLNRLGQDAYLYPTAATNPMWHTPMLTAELVQQHVLAGRWPITVYPEVVSGNPRASGSVVRYLLNRPGLIGGDTEFPVTDLIFAYTQHLLPEGEDPAHVLFMPAIDSAIFHNRDNPLDGQRSGWLIYPGRHAAGLQEHPELAARCTVITSNWPSSPQEMAQLFRRSERVYCFESTSIALEAILCGCPAIVLPSPFFSGTPLGVEELGTYGLAFEDTPAAIEQAIAGIPEAHQRYVAIEDRFWDGLDVFIRDTQALPWTPVLSSEDQQAVARKNAPLLGWLQQRRPNEAQAQVIARHLQEHAGQAPHIACIVLPGAHAAAARATCKSLRADPYPHLGILEASNPDAAALNALVAQSTAQWLCCIEAGTTLTPQGMTPIALELMQAPHCRAVVADEIVREATGELHPLLRPDFNLDMFLSWPAGMARHWFFRRDVFLGAGGLDAAYPQAREFELLLRLVEKEGLAGLGHVHEPLFITAVPVLADVPDEIAAIKKHLRVRGYEQCVVDTGLPGRYRILYGHVAQPLVSIVIAVGDAPEAAQCSVRSILEQTGYPRFEILLVAGLDTSLATQAWLQEQAVMQDERIRVVRPLGTIGRSQAVRDAAGDYVVLLSAGAAVLQEGWIDALLNHALRPEVGAVGARLVQADGRVAHGAMVLGLQGLAAEAFAGSAPDDAGYLYRLQIDQDCSAVSEACCMVRRTLLEEVGGLEEPGLAGPYAALDLCLKIGKSGHLVVWTPHVVLQLETGAKPQAGGIAALQAETAMYRKWLPQIAHDPAYNQNLTLQGKGFELETTPDLNWNPLPWRPLPTVLSLAGALDESAHYRLIHPAISLVDTGVADVRLSVRPWLPAEVERLQPDAWVFQGQLAEPSLTFIEREAPLSRAFKVADLGGWPIGMQVQQGDFSQGGMAALRRLVGLMDRLVVPAAAWVDRLGRLHSDIRVVPACLPPLWWQGLGVQRRRDGRPRVGLKGSGLAPQSAELMRDVMAALAGEVDWVLLGGCPELLRPWAHEVQGAVAAEQYPQMLAGLGLDLVAAVQQEYLPGAGLGTLRLLQYGACGYPVVCSDSAAWCDGLPVTSVRNRPQDWVAAIRMHTHDLDASAAAGDALRRSVMAGWMLEGNNLKRWLAAWLPG